MAIQQNLENTINELKALITKKYPTAVFPKNPLKHILNRYASDGNTRIGTYYRCDFGFVVDAPESSHEDLKPSPTHVNIFITFEDGFRKISFGFPVSSVDVNYIKFDKRVNQRNITLGRQHNRKVVKWTREQLTKKIDCSLELDANTNQALIRKIGLHKEAEKIRNEAYRLSGEIVPSKDKLRQMRRRGIPHNPNQFGFSKEKNTYYHNDIKVGTKSDVYSYIKNNIELFMENFSSECPFTAEKKSKIPA